MLNKLILFTTLSIITTTASAGSITSPRQVEDIKNMIEGKKQTNVYCAWTTGPLGGLNSKCDYLIENGEQRRVSGEQASKLIAYIVLATKKSIVPIGEGLVEAPAINSITCDQVCNFEEP